MRCPDKAYTPELAAQLRSALQTGTLFRLPAEPTAWKLS